MPHEPFDDESVSVPLVKHPRVITALGTLRHLLVHLRDSFFSFNMRLAQVVVSDFF